MISIGWVILPILLIKTINTGELNSLVDKDLKGENVGFKKYENKCVLVTSVSAVNDDKIAFLNNIYEEFNSRGLEIAGISSGILYESTKKKCEKMGVKFNIYRDDSEDSFTDFSKQRNFIFKSVLDAYLIPKDGDKETRLEFNIKTDGQIDLPRDKIKNCLGLRKRKVQPRSLENNGTASEKYIFEICGKKGKKKRGKRRHGKRG